MQLHDLVQGSDAWHQFRSEHDGSSECAPMMGLSKKVTRTELLHMKKTGTPKEFSEWVQKNILDYGHEVEALARPIIEAEFGIDLYPVVCSDGNLSASCDGLTIDDSIAFEHKQWNEALAASMSEGVLPDEYMPQCQQIMMVTGAEKVIFVVSDGTRENMVWMEVFPDQGWFNRIRAGWQQFAIDLDAYVPQDIPEKPRAEAIMQLPALAVQIRGEVTSSNLKQYREAAEQFIAGIKTDLQTDEDFANAEATVKFCDKAEKELELTKKAALSQTASIDELMRTIDHIKDQLREKRLMLDRLVKTQKESIKNEIVSKAKTAFAEHVASLESEIKPIRLIVSQPDLLSAIKNKRTLASLHDSVDTALANAKIAADETAKDIRAKLAWHKENAKGYEFLFSDLDRVIYKAADDFQMLVQNRIAQHKLDEQKKLELQRARIQLEQQQAQEKLLADQAKPVEPEAPKVEQPKPVLMKSEAKPAVSAALMGLAKRDAMDYRKKYALIPELAGVMREIDLFLAASAPAARRA